MSLRARTPSIERDGSQSSTKQLRFPRSNLPSTKNLTLLIKSSPARTSAKEDFLPVEVVAVGGKPGKTNKSPNRDIWPEEYSYTSKINQVKWGKINNNSSDLVLGSRIVQQWCCLLWLFPEAQQEIGRHDQKGWKLLKLDNIFYNIYAK